ncbi:MAG: PEP-CTERM sorting domain-containing protein [Kiritimatiellia bacterium]
MKKMIIMALVAACAIVAQAATCSWTVTNVYAGNSTDKSTGIAYFLTTSMLPDASALSGKSADEITAALGSAYSFKPTTAGTYSVVAANAIDNATLGLQDGTSYTGYLLIFNADTVADATSFFTTGMKDFKTLEGANNMAIQFGTQKTASQQAWSGSVGGGGGDVPEPTSGLLLLIGGAMLALRRKQK